VFLGWRTGEEGRRAAGGGEKGREGKEEGRTVFVVVVTCDLLYSSIH
jgi:hypothetical protein